jgi:Tol biopolymer transport system component
MPSLAPDGSAVAFAQTDADGNDDIFVQRIGGENPVNVTAGSADDDSQPAFSPDGRQIAFRSQRDGGGIFVMGATGESVRRITDEGFNPAWSPDGREIVYATEGVFGPESRQQISRLMRVDLATGTRSTVYDGDAVQPSWSPDGRWLAFWGLPEGSGRRVIFTMPAAGGTPNTLVDDAALNWSPVWSADGRYVYFASDREPPMNIWRLAIDPSTAAAAGTPERVTISTEEHWGLSGSAGGPFVVPARTRAFEIRRYPMNLSSGRVESTSTPVWRTTRSFANVVPSPDGQYLALFVSDPREDLVVMRTDGTGITRLTNDEFRDRGPAWTADSSRIYFYSDRSGQYEGWSIRRDGSGLEQVTNLPDGVRLGGLLPSPDGVIVAQMAISPTIHLAFIDTSVPLSSRTVEDVPLPDGASAFTAVAWLSADEVLGNSPGTSPGTTRILAYSRSTKRYRLVAETATSGVGRAGQRLLGVGGDGTIILVDPATGRIQTGDRITDRLSPRASNAAPSASGDALFVTERDTITNLWLLTVGPDRQP